MRNTFKQHFQLWLALGLIIVLAIFTRLYQLGQVPSGLTWDEAALGYVGRMVITTGRDEYGDLLPTTFVSFGDYKSPLAFYFTGSSTAIFGLSAWAVRLPFALAGVGSVLLIMWFTWRLWRQPWLALLAGFGLITLPWHFVLSRVGFEAGTALFFFLCLLTGWLEMHQLKANDSVKKWIFAGLLIIIGTTASLYTYHSAKIVIPLTWFWLIVHEFIHHRTWLNRQLKKIVVIVLSIGVLSLPALIDILTGPGLKRADSTTVFGQQDWLSTISLIGSNLAKHLSLDWLLLGPEPILRHGTAQFGVLLFGHLILFWLGLTFILGRSIQRFNRPSRLTRWQKKIQTFFKLSSTSEPTTFRPWFWLILLFVTLLPAAIGLDVPHANRALLAVVPVIMLMILGARELQRELSHTSFSLSIGLIVLLMIMQFSVFWNYYFTDYQAESSAVWLDGQATAVRLAHTYQQDGQRIKFTDYYGQPLTFYAFYNDLPIQTYREFRVPNLDFGPVKVEDFNKYDVVISSPAEIFPGRPARIIYRQDKEPAFLIYEME